MADVVLPYVPADASVLDPDGINKDIYETPNNLAAGRASLYETSNGRIEFASNFAAGFKVKSHHVRPWQVGDAASAGLLKPLDFYEDVWGKDTVFYGIAGLNITWFQKYDATVSLLLASVFFSTWRQRGKGDAQSGWASHDIILRMYLDGRSLAHTARELPETVFYPSTANGGFNFSREQNLTRYLNLFHAKVDGGDASKQEDKLTRGWHSFGMGIFVATNDATETVNLDGVPVTGNIYPEANFDAIHRARAYVKHADVVRLL